MKFKKAFATVLAVSVVSAVGMQTAFAANMAQVPQKALLINDEASTALGGWDEESGYFQNSNVDNDLIISPFAVTSTPSHTGKRERSDFSGNTHYRAHGWTTWSGVYHYTRARLEVNGQPLYDRGVTYDSGRVWGMNGTEAVTQWWPWQPGMGEKARTYYGRNA